MSNETDCENFGTNDHPNCQRHFVNSFGMYEMLCDIHILRNAFFVALFTPSFFFVNLLNTIILLLIFSNTKTNGCSHREFGMTYCVLNIFGSIVENMLGTYIVRSSSWMGFASYDVTQISHSACKYFAFLKSYLSASISNILLAHVILHAFTAKLHTERKKIKISVVALNVVCVAAAGYMAAPSFLFYGNWMYAGKFICMPDPEWSQPFVVLFIFHEVVFCDGLVQSLVIIMCCLRLFFLRNHMKEMVRCLYFNTDSTMSVFTIIVRIRQRIRRKMECFKIVIVHSGLIAVTRIIRSFLSLIYNGKIYFTKTDINKQVGVLMLIYFFGLRDILYLLELGINMMHLWLCYFWQLNLHNSFIHILMKIMRPSKRLRRRLAAYLYVDEVKPAPVQGSILGTRKMSKNPHKHQNRFQEVDKNYLHYLQVLSTHLSPSRLQNSVGWLSNQPSLPLELEIFRQSINLDYENGS